MLCGMLSCCIANINLRDIMSGQLMAKMTVALPDNVLTQQACCCKLAVTSPATTTAQLWLTCPTACSRHLRSSLVAVFALLTPRHCSAVDSSGYPWRPRISGGRSAAWNSLPPETRACSSLLSDILKGNQVSPISNLALSTLTVSRCLR